MSLLYVITLFHFFFFNKDYSDFTFDFASPICGSPERYIVVCSLISFSYINNTIFYLILNYLEKRDYFVANKQ